MKSINLQNISAENRFKIQENIFLPMNFNLVLDYFNNKGKDRVKLEKIKNAFDNIQEYMKTGISGSLNKD